MRTKTVKRHWCDHCNKAGLSRVAMERHELHCTMNPARNCRVCTIINGGYKVGVEEMAALVALLPSPDAWDAEMRSSRTSCTCDQCQYPYSSADPDCISAQTLFFRDLGTAMPKLREATDNCPACILAALRQARIPIPCVGDFDFKTEMQRVFNEHPRSDEMY